MKYRNVGKKRVSTGDGWCMPGDTFETDLVFMDHPFLKEVKTRKKRKAKK